MISEGKQKKINKLLMQGCTIGSIAEATGVSSGTVKNYKKKLSQVQTIGKVNLGDDDDDIKFDTVSLYTSIEEKYTRTIKKDIYLYEDTEEGWTFHMDKENSILKTSALWWSAIVYPESAPKDWIHRLISLGYEVAISPLHDKDVWMHDSPKVVVKETGEIIEKGARYKKGDRKKAHWHIIVKCPKRESFKVMNNLIRQATNGPYVQVCRSLKNAYDYFTHETDDAKRSGKYIYDRDEIQRFNDFHIEPNKYEIGVLQCEIMKRIREEKVTEWYQLCEMYEDDPITMSIIWAKPAALTSLVRSLWLKEHPENRVRLVEKVEPGTYDKLSGTSIIKLAKEALDAERNGDDYGTEFFSDNEGNGV